MKKVGFSSLLPVFLIFLLSACGGGGGGEPIEPSGSAPIVTSVAATSIDGNNATLGGTVNPNGISTQVWFEYGTDSTFQTYSSWVEKKDGAEAPVLFSTLVIPYIFSIQRSTTSSEREHTEAGHGQGEYPP